MLDFFVGESQIAYDFNYIAGVDEVGRGPVAGPIVAAAVIMDPKKSPIKGIADSKLLTHKKRVELREKIIRDAIAFNIAEISRFEIDRIGIQRANEKVLMKATLGLKTNPDFVFIDYFKLPNLKIPNESIVKGDLNNYSIACASIIAKVYRDGLMDKAHENYPEYNFCKNKGYLTKFHLDAILEHGFSDLHRESFWPMRELIHE
ncbi:TPA: ribonuclease HII [candidate division CPR2 bacterium]|uniref:Ribonuclease HII n=1 Tax=candidate division CPR2 bacterium GW2011_GWC1_41_48 TaxID=1618344 RepID=A0A0G0Z7R2_UNCC2|nr:MAG: Ribonuclease HII [candidate division CPR2 bacterium GW2011_GWC2_39_35]KKR28346.1 MAG: Ribonuclease HII [candidate division CPR2 bacterium GW2011_GWD2_39_7]KKS09063.1 MAG: Ribonuclease HII [candidate division CPR2 bacterium GW2011_GWC1_41_48]OGB72542.1 MAG: ribonuclease HII [candidate division CPR2 bacterium GWD2_39_7]HBG81862.1 ribonuclease HII [candidate division CPR2 bacterium]